MTILGWASTCVVGGKYQSAESRVNRELAGRVKVDHCNLGGRVLGSRGFWRFGGCA